jgi:hypothetical protein
VFHGVRSEHRIRPYGVYPKRSVENAMTRGPRGNRALLDRAHRQGSERSTPAPLCRKKTITPPARRPVDCESEDYQGFG